MSTAALSGRRPVRDTARETYYLGRRQVRSLLRQPAAFLPGLLMPIMFFYLMTGALSGFADRFGIGNYKAFQLPLAIAFAVGQGGEGLTLVTDIENGYFEKLLLTPTSRVAILLGAMGGDFLRIVGQASFVTAIALLTGTEFATGAPGAVAFVGLASLWGLAWSGIGYALALKTGSASATQGVFAFFFPLLFLTTAFAPQEALSGWLSTAADFNPVTYLFRGLRSLAMTGWQPGEIALGLAAALGLGGLTLSLAFLALRGRVR